MDPTRSLLDPDRGRVDTAKPSCRGSLIFSRRGGSLVVATLLKLALGLLLLSMAWRVRPGAAAGPALQAKARGLESKFVGIGPSQAIRIGFGVALLPRRLGATLLAGATIGATQTTVGQSMAALALYLTTATVLIWGTILVYVAGGDQARAGIDHAREWVVEHIEAVAFVVALAFGLLFTVQAMVELLT